MVGFMISGHFKCCNPSRGTLMYWWKKAFIGQVWLSTMENQDSIRAILSYSPLWDRIYQPSRPLPQFIVSHIIGQAIQTRLTLSVQGETIWDGAWLGPQCTLGHRNYSCSLIQYLFRATHGLSATSSLDPRLQLCRGGYELNLSFYWLGYD